MVPKDVHVLIPEIFEYDVTQQRRLNRVIKVLIKIGRLPQIIWMGLFCDYM